METKEANRIIEDYMFPELESLEYIPHNLPCFVTSLDALVSVWEKIRRLEFAGYNACDGYHFILYSHHSMETYDATEKTIQEAACIATAKTIKGLKNVM